MKTKIKVLIITMFQPRGNRLGELYHFRTGLDLRPWRLAGLPEGSLWRNSEGVAALVAGVGPVNTAVNVLTLGLQADVDWRKTWWLVCGIAGGNPECCPLGSVILANWVVDGDLAYDLHAADHPPAWTTGLLPLGARRPFGPSTVEPGLFGEPAQVFHLNEKLAAWAHRAARKVPLFDSPELTATRRIYAAFAAGAQPPALSRGDVLSAARFWHGKRHHAWAKHWVKYWTQNRGHFAAASMEDSGTLGALRQLHRLKHADWQRILVLRSISNYTLPPPGQPAHHHLTGKLGVNTGVNFPAIKVALKNNWKAARAIITALLKEPPAPRVTAGRRL